MASRLLRKTPDPVVIVSSGSRLIALICLTVLPAAAWQDVELLRNIQQTNVAIIQRAEPAVVSIARVRTEPNQPRGIASAIQFGVVDPDGPADEGFVPDDFGAGVIIETQNARHPRLILTNYHVVRGGPVAGSGEESEFELWVTVQRQPRFRASIIAADPHSDLAVLTIDEDLRAEVTALRPTLFAPQKGQFVFALGNPYTIAKDGSASASWGIVSNTLRRPYASQPDFENQFRQFETIHHFGTLVQVGLALPLGTSGGALLDLNGDLVGLTTSLAPLKGYEQSAGYAVPFDTGFIRVLEQLTQGYEVEYGFLGVRPAAARRGDFDGIPRGERPGGGAVVISVTANSPAMRADLQPTDIIVAVDRRDVADHIDLMREIALIGPARKARLRVWRSRSGRFITKIVTLGKWPVQNDADVIATEFAFPPWRGIRVDHSTSRARYLRGGGTVTFESGVLVVAVDEARHGLKIQPGDFVSHVDQTLVLTPAEFRAAVGSRDGEAVTLRTTDGRSIVIEP